MNLANFGGSMVLTGNDLAQVQIDQVTGETYETLLKTEPWPLPIIFRAGIAENAVFAQKGTQSGIHQFRDPPQEGQGVSRSILAGSFRIGKNTFLS